MKLKSNKFWSNPITNKITNTGMNINNLNGINFPPHTKNEDKGTIAKYYILENFVKDKIALPECHDRLFVSNCIMCVNNLKIFGIGYAYTFRELIEILLRNSNVIVTYDCGNWILKNDNYRYGNEYKISY